jgi:hypothetical protein
MSKASVLSASGLIRAAFDPSKKRLNIVFVQRPGLKPGMVVSARTKKVP